MRPAKDGFLEARKHPHADFTPKSLRRGVGSMRRGSIWGGKKGRKEGFWGAKAALGWDSSSSRKFLWGLASMRREPGALPMWQECRGNDQSNNRDRDREQQAPSPLDPRLLLLLPPPRSPPPGCSAARGPPTAIAQELESLASKPSLLLLLLKGEERKRRGEEEQLARERRSGRATLSLAQLRWWGAGGGGGGEGPSF